MRKSLYLLPGLMVFILLSAFFSGTPQSKELPVSCLDINILQNEIESESIYSKAKLKFPRVDGLEDKDMQLKINYSLRKDVNDLKNQVDSLAIEEHKASKEKNTAFAPFSIESDFKVTYNKNEIISILMVCRYNSGKNKNSLCFKTRNFNVSTGKSLKLKDVFKYNASYKAKITDEIERQIENTPSLYPGYEMDDFIISSEDQGFYLTENNIVICFQPNGNESPGIIEFNVPFNSLKKELKQQFIQREENLTP